MHALYAKGISNYANKGGTASFRPLTKAFYV